MISSKKLKQTVLSYNTFLFADKIFTSVQKISQTITIYLVFEILKLSINRVEFSNKNDIKERHVFEQGEFCLEEGGIWNYIAVLKLKLPPKPCLNCDYTQHSSEINTCTIHIQPETDRFYVSYFSEAY